MIKQLDNFTIKETPNQIIVDYTKTYKDWFDIIIVLLLGTFISIPTYLLLEGAYKESSFFLLFIGLVLIFGMFLNIKTGLSRIFKPTKNILIIDNSTKTIISKQSIFISKVIYLNDIQTIVIRGHKENVSDYRFVLRTLIYCTISVKLKDNREEIIITLNTNRFIRISNQRIEIELYKKTKSLVLELNKYLNLKYEWLGY